MALAVVVAVIQNEQKQGLLPSALLLLPLRLLNFYYAILLCYNAQTAAS